MNYYILDNGEAYSDHSIYFVKTKWSKNVVEKLLKAVNSGRCGYSIQGIFDAPPKFWNGGWRSLANTFYIHQLFEQDYEDTNVYEPRPGLEELPIKLLEEFQDLMIETKNEFWLKVISNYIEARIK